MPNKPRPIFPALFTLFWAVICGLAALGQLERVNAPRWIFAIMAGVFVLVALHLFDVGPDGRADPNSFLTVWIGPIAVSLLALLADWIAFGPGERRGSSTLSLLFFSSSRSAGGIETRIVFGLAGVFFTVLAAFAIRGTFLDRRTKKLP